VVRQDIVIKFRDILERIEEDQINCVIKDYPCTIGSDRLLMQLKLLDVIGVLLGRGCCKL